MSFFFGRTRRIAWDQADNASGSASRSVGVAGISLVLATSFSLGTAVAQDLGAGASAKIRRHPTVTRANGPASPPESQQGQVTNAKNNAPTAGALPFVPPFFTGLDGGGKFAIDTKGISLNTADDGVKFRIGGRFQEDFSTASVSPRRFRPGVVDNLDGRRTYFESYLSLAGGIEAAFQYDFNDAVRPIVDAVVAYHGFNPFVFTIGNFKEPFNLNQLQSDNTTTFTERSLIDTFAPGRSFGGSVGASGDRWTAAGGVYGANANFGPDTNGIAGTARVTYAPILNDNQVLHFGLAGSYRSLDQNGLTQSFSSKPEDYLFTRALVTTGTLKNIDDVKRFGAEALYQFGSWRVQAEYNYVSVGGINGQRDREFQGGYIEGAWVINGKGRPYRLATPYGADFAVLQGVQVEDSQRVSKGGWGVWEVAGRFSALDLNSKNTLGGTEEDFTAGLNWYPDRNLRFMADYVHAHADPAAFSVGKGAKIDSDLIVGRVNFYW